MNSIPAPVVIRWTRVAAPIVATTLVIAGCSSSMKSGSPAGAGTSGAAVTVATRSGPVGTFLTDGSGRSLYMFASDTSSKSTCSGTCATYWPPLTTSGTPGTAAGVTRSMLTTITRSDGSRQVTYNGHPLYLFKQDTAPGDTNGQGSTNFGAKWWLVAPSGQPITSTASSTSGSPASKSSSSSGGY